LAVLILIQYHGDREIMLAWSMTTTTTTTNQFRRKILRMKNPLCLLIRYGHVQ
jgi:hypothetical protein